MHPYMTYKEMLEAEKIFLQFDPSRFSELARHAASGTPIHIIAEGSSRHFPAGNMISLAKQNSLSSALNISAYGGWDALDQDHTNAIVILISNSGKTKEILDIEQNLRTQNHSQIFSITSDRNSPLALRCAQNSYVLNCGPETAIAATKSVMEQALILQSLIPGISDSMNSKMLSETASLVKEVLTKEIDDHIIKNLAEAEILYFVSKDNGLSAELSLKFSETCKRSISYVGTDIIHGPQQSIQPGNGIIIIDPAPHHIDKLQSVLEKNVGAFVLALGKTTHNVPTIQLPELDSCHPIMQNYIYLALGWNILNRLGHHMKIDIDHPKNVQKIGWADDNKSS